MQNGTMCVQVLALSASERASAWLVSRLALLVQSSIGIASWLPHALLSCFLQMLRATAAMHMLIVGSGAFP
jgi:hypothetical protein